MPLNLIGFQFLSIVGWPFSSVKTTDSGEFSLSSKVVVRSGRITIRDIFIFVNGLKDWCSRRLCALPRGSSIIDCRDNISNVFVIIRFLTCIIRILAPVDMSLLVLWKGKLIGDVGICSTVGWMAASASSSFSETSSATARATSTSKATR